MNKTFLKKSTLLSKFKSFILELYLNSSLNYMMQQIYLSKKYTVISNKYQ
jgi:hypothetical protein